MRPSPADEIVSWCRRRGHPAPVPEFAFAAPVRGWKFDLCWPALLIAVEIEGGAFAGKPCKACGQRKGGRHNRGASFREDLAKYAEATIRGWRVLRVMPEQVRSGLALGWLARLLGPPPGKAGSR